MTENMILSLVLIAVFAIFAMTTLRMYVVTHQDVKLGARVNGLSIDVGKIKKQLREGHTDVVKDVKGLPNMPIDLSGMTLEGFVETMGFDAKELNNPIVRPIAEKIFNQMLKKGNDAQENEVDGY